MSDDWAKFTGGLTPETMAADHKNAMAASREWQEREQDALQWCHRDAKLRPRGVGATILVMLRERSTMESRMTTMLFEAADVLDAVAEGCGSISAERYRELAARCREAEP